MPRRKSRVAPTHPAVKPGTSDNIYTVNLCDDGACHKALLEREKLKLFKIGCGCAKCAPNCARDRPRSVAPPLDPRERLWEACYTPEPGLHHVRLILDLCGQVEMDLNRVRHGVMTALKCRAVDKLTYARLLRLLDFFDVDGERRRREHRERVLKQAAQMRGGPGVAPTSEPAEVECV